MNPSPASAGAEARGIPAAAAAGEEGRRRRGRPWRWYMGERERERDPTSGVCHWQRYHKGEKDFLFPSCTNTPVLLIKFHFSPPL